MTLLLVLLRMLPVRLPDQLLGLILQLPKLQLPQRQGWLLGFPLLLVCWLRWLQGLHL
jgi:hypothetical protein